jgi:tetratricopeptide (TPR) repeat protein
LVASLIVFPGYSQKAEEYFDKGNAKFNLQDFIGAISEYNKAIEVKPDYTHAYLNRGVVKVELQNFKGALVDFNRAIKLDPVQALAILTEA